MSDSLLSANDPGISNSRPNGVLRNYGQAAEAKNLIRDNFRDLARQILGLLGRLEHFTVRNLYDELHTHDSLLRSYQQFCEAVE